MSSSRQPLLPQFVFLASLLLLLATLSACRPTDSASPSTAGGNSGAVRRIAVIPKSTAHVFWNSVEAGAKKAGEELGVEIIWKAPIKESDRAGQIQLVQQLASDNIEGIVLAPLDPKRLVGPVRAATQAGVPVVIIDSGLEAEQGTDYVSFVATNNELGGKLGGEKLMELLDNRGKVVMLRTWPDRPVRPIAKPGLCLPWKTNPTLKSCRKTGTRAQRPVKPKSLR